MLTKSSLRFVFYSLFAIVCFSQCYTILRDFIDNPVVIETEQKSPNFVTIIPGITVCNNNRLSLKKVLENNPNIALAIEEKFPGFVSKKISFVNPSRFDAFRDEVARVFYRFNYVPQDVLDHTSMNHLYEMKPSGAFIKSFECARTETHSIECGNLTRISSIQDRRCSTLIHRGAMYFDMMNNPGIFNVSEEKSRQHSYFNSKEVAKIMIDFEPEDYADLKRQIGARIMFHDFGNVGSNNLDYFVTRGFKYEFRISRKQIGLEELPGEECVDYAERNIHLYRNRVNPRDALGATTCYQNCVANNIIRFSNCWPVTIPYFRNDSLDPENNIKPCDWIKRSLYRFEMGSDTTSADYDSQIKQRLPIYKKIMRFCWSKCPLGCELSGFSVSITRTPWPSKAKMSSEKDGVEYRKLHHCCGLISVKFAHSHYNIQKFRSKYQLVDTLGNIGGLLAVWLGLSIVSVYRGLKKLAEICARRSRVEPEANGLK